MTTELGAGTVTIAGQPQAQHWDTATLLNGGVLRVAQTISWKGPLGYDGVSEIAIRLLPPGSWTGFTPDTPENGLLLVYIEGFAPSVIGTCLTVNGALEAAAAYLRDNYVDSEAAATRIGHYFGEHPDDLDLIHVYGGGNVAHHNIRFGLEFPPAHVFGVPAVAAAAPGTAVSRPVHRP